MAEEKEKPEPALTEKKKPVEPPPEHGGRGGPEPTRFGDWEIKGKCVDF